MARIIVFDSDPAGLACHTLGNHEASDLRAWMYGEWVQGAMIVIPEIVDYEVRRSLILAGSTDGIGRLDDLYTSCIRFLPINTASMKRAAALWADARRRGGQTAHDHSLDADVIFSAQAIEFCSSWDDWQIITENVGHISRYVGERALSRRLVVGNWLRSKRGSLDPESN